MLEQAKKLRKNATETETLFWFEVKDRRLGGHKFRRQCPIGKYIVDFLCLEKKLIVEIDGGQHNEKTNDKIRDEYLSALGFKVMRFWNNELLENMDGVLSTLTLALSQRERELVT
jgi:very-short-patch-repair endonuclease